jgi:hypothetical protein
MAGLLGLGALLAPDEVAADEARRVAGGRIELTVGFVVEPAFEGEPNGLSVQIVETEPGTAQAGSPPAAPASAQATDAATAAATPTPLPGAELTAVISYGDRSLPLPLQATDQPGHFRAPFVPTQPGDYVIRIFGPLAGVEIDEEFRTDPEGIPPVIGVAALQIPAGIPVGQGLLDALAERETEAERARTLGVVGVALGVIGLLAGGLAIVLSRRPPPETVVVGRPEDLGVSTPGSPAPGVE